MDINTTKPSLLIVDDDPLIVEALLFFLEHDFQIASADSRAAAVLWLNQQARQPDLVLIDLGLPPTPHRPDEGFMLIGELIARAPKIKIVVLSGQNDSDNARHARTLGALEFVAKPVDPEFIRNLLTKLVDFTSDDTDRNSQAIVGESLAMQRYRLQLRQYADSPFPVLIEGESGSGKELAAAALHNLSRRNDKPYLTINCAAIAPTLIEAALFGYAKGAFTGATDTRRGYFEEAAEGTLLLDEIGELPLELQPKLLRVLENGEYQRVGETQSRTSRARVIAATNRDLKQEVKAGRFRADLYHRLSVFTLTTPPLRDLGEDRLLLLQYFKRQVAGQFRQQSFELAPLAERLWLAYEFPGNIRELRNIVIRLTARYPGQTISAAALSEEFDPGFSPETLSQTISLAPYHPAPIDIRDRELLVTYACNQLTEQGEGFSLDTTLMLLEDAYIEAARRLSHGNLSQAARILGVNRTTLYNRLDSLMRSRTSETGALS